jgi:uncharacterized membrane protein
LVGRGKFRGKGRVEAMLGMKKKVWCTRIGNWMIAIVLVTMAIILLHLI